MKRYWTVEIDGIVFPRDGAKLKKREAMGLFEDMKYGAGRSFVFCVAVDGAERYSTVEADYRNTL